MLGGRGKGEKALPPNPHPQSHKILVAQASRLCKRVRSAHYFLIPEFLFGNQFTREKRRAYENLRQVDAFPLFCGLVFSASAATAGQTGKVSCTNPGCGYHYDLTIAGGKKSPSLTGYCRSTKKFVREKLKSWEGYRETVPACPDCPEAILPIYDGGQVAAIPCPKCGYLTLHYKKSLMFD